MEEFTLKDKTVLITGASSGLGKSLAKKSAVLGGKVFAAARSLDELKILSDDAKEKSDNTKGTIIPVKTDVRDLESVKNLFDRIDENGNGIDIVINNAAIGHNSKIQDISDDELRDIVNTNLIGSISVTREAINRMLEQNNGHLVFVSSLAGKLAFPNLSIYSATKFGIEGLAESIREELAETGINVTIVRPGIMDTNFFATAGMNEFADTMKNKMQSPDDVADEIINAIANRSHDVTIGSDKRFMPLLKLLPKSIARKLLPYIN
jgi:hypothetical protein